MAGKADFTKQEWEALHKGVSGSGMLVSLSDRDFTDTFGEASAMGKYLAGQQVASTSQLVRDLAHEHSTGFGFTAGPEKVHAETMAALKTAVDTLTAKAPDELPAYRELVVGIAQAVAQAKGGTSDVEQQAITSIREAVGAA
jgi:hypothetical protein